MVIFFSAGYLSSVNCRRELKQALRLGKRLLIIRETDPLHGQVDINDAAMLAEVAALPAADRAACEDLLRRIEAADEADVIEWYRESHLKHAVLKAIVGTVLDEQSCHTATVAASGRPGHGGIKSDASGQRLDAAAMLDGDDGGGRNDSSHSSSRQSKLKVSQLPDLVIVPAGSTQKAAGQATVRRSRAQVGAADTRPGASSGGRPVYVSELYRHVADHGTAGASAFELLAGLFTEAGCELANEAGAHTPFVLLLTPSTFDQDDLVSEIGRVLADGRLPLLPLYSTTVPFTVYMNRCPAELKALGLFDHMFEKLPTGETLQRVTVAHTVASLPAMPTDSGAHVSPPPPSFGFGRLRPLRHPFQAQRLLSQHGGDRGAARWFCSRRPLERDETTMDAVLSSIPRGPSQKSS